MAVHCDECGKKLETVEERRDHHRVQHPVRVWVVIPEDVKYRVITGQVNEVMVRVVRSDLPVRILREEED